MQRASLTVAALIALSIPTPAAAQPGANVNLLSDHHQSARYQHTSDGRSSRARSPNPLLQGMADSDRQFLYDVLGVWVVQSAGDGVVLD